MTNKAYYKIWKKTTKTYSKRLKMKMFRRKMSKIYKCKRMKAKRRNTKKIKRIKMKHKMVSFKILNKNRDKMMKASNNLLEVMRMM